MNEILNEAPFAAKVKYLRAKLMLTQEALAKELGVSFATVNRGESQCRTPQFLSKEKFFGFCEKMGIIFPDNGAGG
jgi:transcriptional regulator, XRE family